MDDDVTNHLVQTVESVSLVSARCVLTGIDLGMDMNKIPVKRDLQYSPRWVLQNLGYGLQAK